MSILAIASPCHSGKQKTSQGSYLPQWISRNRIQSTSMDELPKKTTWPMPRASNGPQTLQSTTKRKPTSFSLACLEHASGKLSAGLSPLVANSQTSGYLLQNLTLNQLSNDVISMLPQQSKLASNLSKFCLLLMMLQLNVGGKSCPSGGAQIWNKFAIWQLQSCTATIETPTKSTHLTNI